VGSLVASWITKVRLSFGHGVLMVRYSSIIDLLLFAAIALAVVVAMVASLALIVSMARQSGRPSIRSAIKSHPMWTGILLVALVTTASLVASAIKYSNDEHFRFSEKANYNSISNLLADTIYDSGPITSTTHPTPIETPAEYPHSAREQSDIPPQMLVSSNPISIVPGSTYRYSLYTFRGSTGSSDSYDVYGKAQVRLLWLDRSLSPVDWNDAAEWAVDWWDYRGADSATTDEIETSFRNSFHTGVYKAPNGASWLKLELRNTGSIPISGVYLKLSEEGVYIEPHPNGASASLAFSFDWETAMGGAVHSKGMDVHDPKGAAEHGMEMREGADWLNDLFKRYDIKATFYATGYNLLDGNTERKTFSGDPTYKWASRKNGWATDYWISHKWYSDDPYGTSKTDPAWYFGDQTRNLLSAGHEIAPHTFGHLYVRGSNPTELATDIDEWLSAAKSLGITNTNTFAFPWRSSNSLTPDFYDVLWKRGIRAVTRVYPLEMKDQYTLGAVAAYPDIAVMPDFLLGAELATGGEGAGNPITGDEGVQVIHNTIERRGTTSFWQHPEQLAPAPALTGIRADWEKVVAEAAKERDDGRLWVDTVANITAYQRDIMSVTVSLDKDWLGGWKIRVHSDLASLHRMLICVPYTTLNQTSRR
jgi:hypothetical protein